MVSRREVLVGAGAAGVVTVAAAEVFLGGIRLPWHRDDQLTSSDAKTFEFLTQETWTTIEVRPDGVQQVHLELTFDAGAGADHPLHLYTSNDLSLARVPGGVQHVIPQVSEPRLTVVAGPHTGQTLEVAAGKEETLGRRLVARLPGGWAAGRHRVGLEQEVAGMWLQIEGEGRLIPYHTAVWASWYGVGVAKDAVLSVRGDPPAYLQQDSQQVELGSSYPLSELVNPSASVGYTFVRPDHVTAPPRPVEVR